MGEKIRSFTDLRAWKEAHKLVLMVYDETKLYPADERFGLTDQSKRSAVSVSSNIAEGFSRFTSPDKRAFYNRSVSSLTELQNQLLIARDVHYITQDKFNLLAKQTIEVSKLVNSLIKYCNSRTA